jgi:ABC-2 type transport system ATP-binding protein
VAHAIETHGLTRRFDTRTAVEGLSLTIEEGTVFGFLGPNGAGKTTTVRMLAALIAPSHGDAIVAGHTLGVDDTALRRSVGILTEQPGLYDRLSARQNLRYFARLYDLDEERVDEQVQRYLQLLELWDRRDEPVGTFSKGMRQKLAIARALLHEPRVVFLDEPTAALDPEAARTVRDFVKGLRAEGRTIFLTTHNLPEADELCDSIGILQRRLLRVGSPRELRASLFGAGTVVRIVGDAAPYVPVVRSLPFVGEVRTDGDRLTLQLDDPDGRNPDVVDALRAAGARIRYVERLHHSLEDVYLRLVGGSE